MASGSEEDDLIRCCNVELEILLVIHLVEGEWIECNNGEKERKRKERR